MASSYVIVIIHTYIHTFMCLTKFSYTSTHWDTIVLTPNFDSSPSR